MVRTTTHVSKPADREQLRRELLKLIIKNEARRRDQLEASKK